jgi:ABC-type transport system involved in Fe-S cluster assembly fused permease/ATPase subunit
MNSLDNEREGRATDVLLNYETVKVFTAERHELASYDNATRKYQARQARALPAAVWRA